MTPSTGSERTVSSGVQQPAAGAWVLELDTPTLAPATATNTLIVGGDRLLIIEPATPHPREQARLDDLLARLGAEGRTPAAIVITHHHEDHIGYAEALRERLGVPILAHAETAARVEFGVDETIDDGWTIDLGTDLGGHHVVEALFTPGHAPGHLVMWDRATDLAHAGDLVAGLGTILIPVDDGGDMGVYLDSLRSMATRVRTFAERGHTPRFVPAHGPVLEQPLELIEHYIAHRLEREDKVRRAVVQQGKRAFLTILAAAYADKPKHVWPIAALSLEAHLQKLVNDGELVRRGRGARPA